jgi:hypothetical protein
MNCLVLHERGGRRFDKTIGDLSCGFVYLAFGDLA